MTRAAWPSLFPLVLVAACGARSSIDLFGASSGQGGAAGAGGSSSSAGGRDERCDGLVVGGPVVTAPTPSIARAPGIGLLQEGEGAFLSFIEAPPQSPGLLRAARLEAFDAWPPALGDIVDLDAGVIDYVTGPGPAGPVALIRQPAGDPSFLATTLFPQIEGIPLSTGSDRVLFATAIDDRYLAAQATVTPAYEVLGVGSYQPGSLPQSEEPLLCITSPVAGAAVAAGRGFLAAFVEPNPPEPGCDVQAPLPGTIVSVMRYAAPGEPGSFLERTQGAWFVEAEPIAHLALAAAPFGAWVVWQTDGSTSRVMPPIVAARVNEDGQPVAPGEGAIAVSPEGIASGAVAAAEMGDALAVAWIEAIDPSAPAIQVRLIRSDGALGPSISIDTGAAFWSSGLRLQASAGGRSLLLAWEGGFDDPRVGLARVDCVAGP